MQLVIAEKPSVGLSLAKALGITEKKTGYMEGNDYIISWYVGHLVGFANADSYDEKYKKWNIADLPIIPEKWIFDISKEKMISLVFSERLCPESLRIDTKNLQYYS